MGNNVVVYYDYWQLFVYGYFSSLSFVKFFYLLYNWSGLSFGGNFRFVKFFMNYCMERYNWVLGNLFIFCVIFFWFDLIVQLSFFVVDVVLWLW